MSKSYHLKLTAPSGEVLVDVKIPHFIAQRIVDLLGLKTVSERVKNHR